jgi:hypothetical protein
VAYFKAHRASKRASEREKLKMNTPIMIHSCPRLFNSIHWQFAKREGEKEEFLCFLFQESFRNDETKGTKNKSKKEETFFSLSLLRISVFAVCGGEVK